MAHAMTLPVLAGLSLLGAAVGVHLGRSAIAEINPAYFSEPETRFHADLVPYRSTDWAQVQAAEYHQSQQIDGLGSGCIGCRDYPEEYYPRHEPAIEGYADGWSASAAQPVEIVFVEQSPDPERQQVERYASYPVSAEEARAAVAAVPAEETQAPAEEAYAAAEEAYAAAD